VVDAASRKRARALPLKLLLICLGLGVLLLLSMLLGLSVGPSGRGLGETWAALTGQIDSRSTVSVIIWQIRMPRVVLAAAVGAVLGVGGAVFQALLGNPLAEPYILGISGGSAVGALAAMLLGFSLFPGMTLAAFGGSILVLVIVFFLGVGRSIVNKEVLLLGGVMMNAFCGALIMFFVASAAPPSYSRCCTG
jgi:iron complex transport system permease protein